MKREWNVIEKVLNCFENAPVGKLLSEENVSVAGYDQNVVDAHIQLLNSEGYLAKLPPIVGYRLTWTGYDLLDELRTPMQLTRNPVRQMLSR